jgi:hypothetical protein
MGSFYSNFAQESTKKTKKKNKNKNKNKKNKQTNKQTTKNWLYVYLEKAQKGNKKPNFEKTIVATCFTNRYPLTT